MATVSESAIPVLFNNIIKQRVSDYINKEVAEMVRLKTDEIVTDVLGNLQVDAQLYKDMLRYETKLVVNAVYNGVDVTQKETP